MYSKKQLKSRLPKWGLDIKNLRGDIIIRLTRTKAKHKKFKNKDTSFRVNKKTVRNGNIDRYLQRHNISEEELLAMASPIDGELTSLFSPN
jgi:glycine cleavage system regulatory protein